MKCELDQHSVDVQGTKTRIRSCHPAEHGGKPCPEKNEKNLGLYEEKMDCSRVDCESRLVMKSLNIIILMMMKMIMYASAGVFLDKSV